MGEISSLKGEINSLRSQLNGVAKQSTLESVNGAISNLGQAINAIGNSIAQLLIMIGAIPSQVIEAIRAILLALLGGGNNGQKLDEILSLLGRLFSALTARFSRIDAALNSINNEIGKLQRGIEGVAGRVSEILNYVRSLIDINQKLNSIGAGVNELKGLARRILNYFPLPEPDLSRVLSKLEGIASNVSRILDYVRGLIDINERLRKLLSYFPLKFPQPKEPDLSKILARLENIASNVSRILDYVKSLGDIYQAVKDIPRAIAALSRKVDEVLRKTDRIPQQTVALTTGTPAAMDWNPFRNAIEAVRKKLDLIDKQWEDRVGKGVNKSSLLQQVDRKVSLSNDRLARALADLSRIFNYVRSLEDISKTIGVSDFPVKTPETLLAHTDKKSLISHKSLAELIVWQTRQQDAVLGQFPIEIEIEDIDPLTEGNQTKLITLPNLSEAIAELFGLTLSAATETNIGLNYLNRIAVETIAAKNAAIVAQDYARANASYLGYQGKSVKREIPYAFDPAQVSNLGKFLENSTGYLKGWANEDKNTVAEYLQRLMFAAGIIKQVYFRPARLSDKITKALERLTKNENDEQAWKDFLEWINNPSGDFSELAKGTPDIRVKEHKRGT